MAVPEMIAVLQAFQQGKQIEYRRKDRTEWQSSTPGWNFADCEYRVKPEPRTYWVTTDPNGYPLEIGSTPAEAKNNTRRYTQDIKMVKVREVLE